MAHKTSHRLKVRYYADSTAELEDKLRYEINNFIEEHEDLQWVISEGLNEWGEDDRSFENKNTIIKELSEKYFYLIFILEYDPLSDFEMGEVREYWYQGKIQKEYAEIKVNSFDLNKLEKPKGGLIDL